MANPRQAFRLFRVLGQGSRGIVLTPIHPRPTGGVNDRSRALLRQEQLSAIADFIRARSQSGTNPGIRNTGDTWPSL